ncbi:MAG TPA: type VI secretion system baseplate subunit TssE [Pyrinomonadaceae bacterium]|jgi:type VI secretion system protein ImpF|nr:type VI secretion system baseplate subunit TssE [Pyrinomonadaceae bacterium]
MSSRYDNEVRVTLSVLDRLIDFEPEISREPVASRAKNLRQLKQAVKRDLEWLLNTRQVVDGVPADLKELSNSLAAYGLPDFTTASADNLADQIKMRRSIEDVIRLFEPRLEDVSVSVEPARGLERVMHFRIDARLKVDPAPEPVTFDTMLQLGSGQYLVQGE